MHFPTVARYLGKSFLHPSRAMRNGIRVLKFALLNPVAERKKLFEFLQEEFHVDTAAMQREFEGSEFHEWTRSRRQALAEFPGPYRFGSTGEWDCEALYYLVRALKPQTVVETGVCYGASTSYILEALRRNGGGHLHSIDLGNTPNEPRNDFFVHPSHHDHWTLIIGDSKAEMPPLLQRLGEIDLFHHDSLHTYQHMMWEYETVVPHLSQGGALSSDDVSTILDIRHPFQRSPFADFCDRQGWKWRAVRNFGLAVRESRHNPGVNRHPRPAAPKASSIPVVT
jgi:predicted O-methyltransferase YrrM